MARPGTEEDASRGWGPTPLLLAVLCLAFLAWSGAARAERPNLILVSLDTTRADALSCDGVPPGVTGRPTVTPVLDALAAEGLRFERFYAHAPTTLNSHTTMFTGLDPHQHAIPRNGFPLPAALDTLAERLSAVGYQSIAVVGAAALEHATNFDQGFEVYDDQLPEKHGPMYQDRAAGVVSRARAALAERDPRRPLFLFVHFYDPHTPYAAPGEWRRRFSDPGYDGPFQGEAYSLGPLHHQLLDGTANPADIAQVASLYLSEVAYMDHHVGLLLEHLRGQGLLDHALVVITADHGEVLAERPQTSYSHGGDVTDGVMRIPLILRGYGVPLAERAVVRRQASLAELAPTVELLLGLEPELGARRHLIDLVRPGPVLDEDGWPAHGTRPVFMEATRPRWTEPDSGWNNLRTYRGVRAGGWVVISAPFLDLEPTLEQAPRGMPQPSDGQLLDVLARQLRDWDAGAPQHQDAEIGPATRQALEALGYLEPIDE